MKVIETALSGVLILEPDVVADRRGFFVETYHQQRYSEFGLDAVFVQDNHSRSVGGVLRGLHYQLQQPQGKLVRVAYGKVYDVAVDVRRGSPTFGQWAGAVLDDISHRQIYLPPGFAHGFCVLSDIADFVYKCTNFYHPESQQGIRWDDPALGIDWPLEQVILSTRDAAYPLLADQSEDLLPLYAG